VSCNAPAARNPLNYFEPYEHYPAHYENELTRALVVLLKLSPLVQEAWLRRVVRHRAFGSFPERPV
jgi:hypothetical protein